MKYVYQPKDANLKFEDVLKMLRQKLENEIIVGEINSTDPNCRFILIGGKI